MSKTFSIVMGALAVAGLALGGIAYASIPDSSGTIHGCYKKNGDLYVIDDAQGACKNNESALSWNEQGPQGLQGPPGEPGAKGDKGDKGDTGRGIGTQYTRTVLIVVQPGMPGFVDATCDTGDLLLSGGFGATPNVAVTVSEPERIAGPNIFVGWATSATNTGTTPGTLSAEAFCADVTP